MQHAGDCLQNLRAMHATRRAGFRRKSPCLAHRKSLRGEPVHNRGLTSWHVNCTQICNGTVGPMPVVANRTAMNPWRR
jgi:hypothetical protein